MNTDELLVLKDEPLDPTSPIQVPWRVLVVDDDADVHEVTRFSLGSVRVLSRPLELLHAHSADEAKRILNEVPNIAVILLDVVMESEDAGLQLVKSVRQEQRLASTRIILRTGQPGHAPEAETITLYDINDYKTKSELTQTRLFTSLTTAIRSYDQLRRLERSRHGLELIVNASNKLNAMPGLRAFAEGLLTQISALIGVDSDGVVCAVSGSPEIDSESSEPRIIAAVGRFARFIQRRLSEIDDERIVEALATALREKKSSIGRFSATFYFPKSGEEGFAALIDASQPIPDIDRDLVEVFCSNIALCAKNVDLVAELRHDAFVDRQLGMPNRTALLLVLNQRIHNDPHGEGVLAIIDLDQFAAINDILGHHYGDLLLRTTAQHLRKFFGPGNFVARLAGDAFAVVGNRDAINPESIQRCFSDPFEVMGIRQPISACTGLVALDRGFEPGAEYLKDGYLAMKRAKDAGLAQTMVYTNDLAADVRSRARLLHSLRSGYESGQFFLAYQPQIDLVDERLIGAEALLRWRAADGTMIPPASFIPIAEKSGLIVDMGRWLLREALLARHRLSAATGSELRMAVNVSAVQVRRPDFSSMVIEVLRETATPAAALEIEITESVAIAGIEAVIAQFAALRQLGVTVALDDFGTGYSSLSYLERLPIDRLKIDRSFVLGLEFDQGQRIARTIIVLGKEMGLKIIAEGVESPALRDRVVEIGCHEAQGYHFARPMIEREFIDWFQRRQVNPG